MTLECHPTRQLREELARPVPRWWQVLLGGVSVLAATVVVLNIVGEVPEGWWVPMMLTLLGGILTTATGLILGIAHLTTNRPRTASG